MSARIHLRAAVVVVGLAAAFAACAAQAAVTVSDDAVAPAEAVLEENWYALYLNGQKAGHQHERFLEVDGPEGAVYETRLHQEFTIARGSVTMRAVVDTHVREEANGRLVAFRQRNQGLMQLLVRGRVEGPELVLTSKTQMGETTQRVPRPDGLCPWALRQLARRKGNEPGTHYVAEAFLAESPGRPVGVEVDIIGVEKVQVFEVVRQLHRADIRISILPGMVSSEWSDDDGAVWLARAQLGGSLALELRKTTQELATSQDDPADLLAASFVATDRRIPNPRALARLEMLLVSSDEQAPVPELPAGPFQSVRGQDGGLLVSIRRAEEAPERSYRLPYQGDDHADELRPNVWMETDDDAVRRAAREATDGETDALRAARLVESYVWQAIERKDLSVGFATAAETLAQRAGDCSEHAVLAAALARAVGMPSRVVGGLVYAESLPGMPEGGFGYHMWAEVYVGEWLPLDAALGGHDATHVTLVRSDLNEPDDLLEMSAAISRLFGTVRVVVLSTDEGRDAPIPAHVAEPEPSEAP